MRRTAISLLLLVVEPALGGTVIFDPPQAIVQPGEPARFVVSVDGDMPVYDSVGLLFGTNEGGASTRPLSFQPSPLFFPGPCDTCVTIVPIGVFGGIWLPFDIFIGGNRFAAPEWGTSDPLLIGTLMVDTTGLPSGVAFEVFVNGNAELELLGTAISAVALGISPPEPLEGHARVNVVPEPAMMGIMPVMGLAVLRARAERR